MGFFTKKNKNETVVYSNPLVDEYKKKIDSLTDISDEIMEIAAGELSSEDIANLSDEEGKMIRLSLKMYNECKELAFISAQLMDKQNSDLSEIKDELKKAKYDRELYDRYFEEIKNMLNKINK